MESTLMAFYAFSLCDKALTMSSDTSFCYFLFLDEFVLLDANERHLVQKVGIVADCCNF